jgi:SAM-dependent methyltransferase
MRLPDLTLRSALAAVWRGESLLRATMDAALEGLPVAGGLVVDVGGAKSASYLGRLAIADGARVESVDGATHAVDFEKDALPYADGAAASALCFNVLEHVYDHRHLAREIRRVLAPGGQLVGFVPFFVQYHPDPRDYFRYTDEALEKIFAGEGFASVEVAPVGQGAVGVCANSLVLSIPRALRPVLVALAWPLMALALRLRPNMKERYPLGYVFVAR